MRRSYQCSRLNLAVPKNAIQSGAQPATFEHDKPDRDRVKSGVYQTNVQRADLHAAIIIRHWGRPVL